MQPLSCCRCGCPLCHCCPLLRGHMRIVKLCCLHQYTDTPERPDSELFCPTGQRMLTGILTSGGRPHVTCNTSFARKEPARLTTPPIRGRAQTRGPACHKASGSAERLLTCKTPPFCALYSTPAKRGVRKRGPSLACHKPFWGAEPLRHARPPFCTRCFFQDLSSRMAKTMSQAPVCKRGSNMLRTFLWGPNPCEMQNPFLRTLLHPCENHQYTDTP